MEARAAPQAAGAGAAPIMRRFPMVGGIDVIIYQPDDVPPEVLDQQVRSPDDRREDVVEIVSHATGQAAERGHPLTGLCLGCADTTAEQARPKKPTTQPPCSWSSAISTV